MIDWLSKIFRVFGNPSSSYLEETTAIIDRYRLLTENLAAAVLLRDGKGKIIYCSPYTEVLTGYPLGQILSHSDDFFATIVHEKDKEHYNKAQRVALCGESFQFRYRFYHKSGLEMWAETRSVPIDDSAEDQCPTLSITLDVTGHVLYQKQVEDRNRDLQDFAYMITHDLKAPVFTIRGMMGILDEEIKAQLNGEQQEVFEHIKKAIRRLEELIGGVLEYSRVSAESVTATEIVDLQSVLESVVNDHSMQIQAVKADLKIAENLPQVLGERMKLYRVFANLISNALKYTCSERLPQICIEETESKTPRRCTIAVKDNGPGIPKDKRELIFRPFQRLSPGNVEGTGIGLASVKKLLEKLGGDIEVVGEEADGSTFLVTLRKA